MLLGGKFMKKVILSKHCKKRIDERVYNINKRVAKKLVYEAFNNGITFDKTSGKKKLFLKRKTKDRCIAKFYKGWIYIFDYKNTCVTLYEAPSIFVKSKYKFINAIRSF